MNRIGLPKYSVHYPSVNMALEYRYVRFCEFGKLDENIADKMDFQSLTWRLLSRRISRDLHVRSCKHVYYHCVSRDGRNAQALCTDHLAALTQASSIYLSISLSIYLYFSFVSLPVCKTYRNVHEKQNKKKKKTKLCVPTGRSPLQCPWVLSISGKEARPSADCRECCVKYSRLHPRPGRSACPSIVISYRATRYSRTNRQC